MSLRCYIMDCIIEIVVTIVVVVVVEGGGGGGIQRFVQWWMKIIIKWNVEEKS